MISQKSLTWLKLAVLALPLSACSASVFLIEAFTDIDEHIADEMRGSDSDSTFMRRDQEDDDATRFPNAEENCVSYGETLADGTNRPLMERQYLKAMKDANCRAS